MGSRYLLSCSLSSMKTFKQTSTNILIQIHIQVNVGCKIQNQPRWVNCCVWQWKVWRSVHCYSDTLWTNSALLDVQPLCAHSSMPWQEEVFQLAFFGSNSPLASVHEGGALIYFCRSWWHTEANRITFARSDALCGWHVSMAASKFRLGEGMHRKFAKIVWICGYVI